MINTFEEKLAYEIGVKLAQQDYLEKEASMAAFKALGSGLKGVATGQGATVSQAFRQGVQQSAYTGAQGFRGVAKDIGRGLARPFQDMYRTYGARTAQKGIQQGQANVQAAQKSLEAARASGKGVAEAEKALATAQSNVRNLGDQARKTYGGTGTDFVSRNKNFFDTARRGYIPRDAATGAVNYGALGTMATGLGLAGTGTYMAGNAAFGGGDTYVNQVQPQTPPHQYYMNQLSNYFK